MGLAVLAVACFSLTVPATRAAVPELGALLVGAGRSAVAALLALCVLLVRRDPLPQRSQLLPLCWVALGVAFVWPLCSAQALRSVPSVHALVIIGLVPMVTALFAVFRNGERPSRAFWTASVLGAAAVFTFGVTQAPLHFASADAWLVLAVIGAAFGYSEGARLTPSMGGWRVISWALVLTLPLSFSITAYAFARHPVHQVSWGAGLGFGYVAVVSMYLGLFAWYRGLALTGVARASQVQLAQPVLGFFWSWLLLGEAVSGATLLTALFVLACAASASRARVRATS